MWRRQWCCGNVNGILNRSLHWWRWVLVQPYSGTVAKKKNTSLQTRLSGTVLIWFKDMKYVSIGDPICENIMTCSLIVGPLLFNLPVCQTIHRHHSNWISSFTEWLQSCSINSKLAEQQQQLQCCVSTQEAFRYTTKFSLPLFLQRSGANTIKNMLQVTFTQIWCKWQVSHHVGYVNGWTD